MFGRDCFKVLGLMCLILPFTACTTGDPSLTSIVVSPTTMNFGGAGLQTQLTATGYFTHPGHPAVTEDITNQVTWASSTVGCVTVSQTGMITSGSNVCSNILVTASAPGFNGLISGSMTVNVTQPTGGGGGTTTDVTKLTITPGADSVSLPGQTGQFIAIGTTSSGAQVNLTTNAAAWGSSNASVATIGVASGLATATGAGTTTITAIYANADGTAATGQATFTVTGSSAEPLQSLAITPGTETIVQGQTSQLIAIGTFSSTSLTPGTQNLTDSVTWTSSDASIASITNPGGLVTAVGAGTAAITAIAKNPDNSVVTSTAVITVTATATGSASEPLVSLAILPATQTVAGPGQQTQFLAIGTFSASSTTPGTQNMANINTYTVAWYSSVASVATITNAGVATAVGQGTTAITAIATNIKDGSSSYATAVLTVTGVSAQQITSLTIIPGLQTITMPLAPPTTPTTFFAAIGTNATGLQVNETDTAGWTSSNTAVATINANTGAVTPVGPGTTTITALYNNPSTATTSASVVTATADLTVSGVASEPLLSIAILPGSQSIAYPGQTSQLTAIGTFSAAPVTQNLTTSTTYPVTWISSDTAVATVAADGLVTATGQGTAAITAVASNPDKSVVTGVATITVTNSGSEQVTALTIVPNALTLSATGQPGQFIALATSASGVQEDVTNSPQIAWTSSLPTIATICTQASGNTPAFCATTPGQAQGVSAGSTNITAEFTNPASGSVPANVVTASGTVTVTNSPAAEPLLSIAVLPGSVTILDLDSTAQYLAFGTFSTAPTVMDVTNGFYHSGFPNAACTAALAAANTLAIQAGSPAPNVQCSFVPVSWFSLPEPFVFPINSAGAPGAFGGLVTAWGAGTNEAIYAVAANPDGTLSYSTTGNFSCPYAAPTYGTTTVTNPNGTTTTTTDYNDVLNPGTCNALTFGGGLLSTLTVFDAYPSTSSTGLNQANWLITAQSATTPPVTVIHCGGATEQALPGGSVCEATYPNGTVVTLTAPAEPGVSFGGWSSNCTNTAPVTAAGPNSCTVVVGGGCVLNQQTETYICTSSANVSVGGIFN